MRRCRICPRVRFGPLAPPLLRGDVLVAVALAWRAELVAALGLIGAIAAPALLATEGGRSATGVGFAALVAVAAAVVGDRLRWQWLLVGAAVASAPQIAALVIEADRLDAGAISLSAVFALIYLGTGIADQLERRDEGLAPLPTMFILGSIAVTWLAAAQLFGPAGGHAAGFALVVAASVFASATIALWVRGQRELATLIGTIALAAAAVGVANVLSDANLAYTFAAEAAVLAFAARRVREARLQLAALAYLVLAGAHALIFDSPPGSLFVAARHPAAPIVWSLAGVAAVAVATRRGSRTARIAAFAWLAVTALEVAAYDGTQLAGIAFSLSFGAVAVALVLAGYLREVLGRRTSLSLETTVAVLVGVAYAVASLYPVDTERQFGFAPLRLRCCSERSPRPCSLATAT